MLAALEAARAGAAVLLLERNEVVGRKLLATGNGRCNLSNAGVAAARYTCADREFLARAFEALPPGELLAYLRGLGILTYATADGWYYPLSNSAATVAEAFAAALELAGVDTRLQTAASDLQPKRGGFLVAAGGETLAVERLVLAAGGTAYPALGSRGDFLPLLERLGHTLLPPRPALAPILADARQFHKLQGVRLDVKLGLYEGERLLGESAGNMMFTRTGFSGPAPMDLSHLVSARPGAELRLKIDLLPRQLSALRELIGEWRGQAQGSAPLRVLLGAALPPKVPPVLLGLAGLQAEARLSDTSEAELERLLRLATGLMARVKGTGGLDVARLSAGGVPVTEVEPVTFESRRVAGLHLVGEVLDVVGPCGGYNLHYAFTSGVLAGRAVAG